MKTSAKKANERGVSPRDQIYRQGIVMSLEKIDNRKRMVTSLVLSYPILAAIEELLH